MESTTKVRTRINRDSEFYYTIKRMTHCSICGEFKRKKAAFCWLCIHKLPPEMSRRLYLPIGAGFDEAFDKATVYLSKKLYKENHK